MNEQKTYFRNNCILLLMKQLKKDLDQLGLPRDAVTVEVLDEGKGGFLGMGNRQVRVRFINR